MKRIYTALCLLPAFLFCAAQPNNDFEIWSYDTVGYSPESWYTFVNTTGRTDDAAGQNYAAKLETKVSIAGPVPGYLGNVPISNLFTFPNIEGGAPFNETPDSFYFDAKYNIQSGDQGIVVILFKNSNGTIGYNMHQITGSQSAFTSIGLKCNIQPGEIPDSVIIAFSSSNVILQTSIPGSTLTIDNVRFTGTSTATIDNSGLEVWDPFIYEKPESWSSIDELAGGFALKTTSKTSDAQAGSLGVRLESVMVDPALIANTNIPGFLISTEKLGFDGFNLTSEGGFAYNDNQRKLEGYYKYSPVGNDSATVIVLLKNNGLSVDTAVMNLGPAAAYTKFEMPVKSDLLKDTIIIMVSSGMLNPEVDIFSQMFVAGSILYIDEISLSEDEVSGINKLNPINAFDVVPNPSKGAAHIYLETEAAINLDYSIMDVSGKLLSKPMSIELASGTHSIPLDLSAYASGVYFVKLHSGDFNKTLRLVKN